MCFVAVKSEVAQGAAVVFRTRDILVRQRTQIINALRGHLAECGLIVAQGPVHVAKLTMAVQHPEQPLPEAARPVLCVLVDMLGLLDQRIKLLDVAIARRAKEDEVARRLMSVPGVGPVIVTAMAALAPSAETFKRGRDLRLGSGSRHYNNPPEVNRGSARRRDCLDFGGMNYQSDAYRQLFAGGGLPMRWVWRLVEMKGEGQLQGTDVIEIVSPDDLGNIVDSGLTLSEAKELQARVQHEVAAAQARGHAVQRPNCWSCGGTCHVKDYRDHQIATLFGRVTVRLPRFRCKACSAVEAGVSCPMNCRSTPELDELQAHFRLL